MTLNFLDDTCTKIENMAFKTSQMNQIALEYWYYGFLGRLRVDGRGFLHKTPILKNCSPEQKSSCRTCAEACHSPFKRLTKFQVRLNTIIMRIKIPSEKEKRFARPTRLLPGSVGFCNVHMYDEFHVPDMLIVLLYMWRLWIFNSQGYWVKQKQSYKFSISDFPKLYPATL